MMVGVTALRREGLKTGPRRCPAAVRPAANAPAGPARPRPQAPPCQAAHATPEAPSGPRRAHSVDWPNTCKRFRLTQSRPTMAMKLLGVQSKGRSQIPQNQRLDTPLPQYIADRAAPKASRIKGLAPCSAVGMTQHY